MRTLRRIINCSRLTLSRRLAVVFLFSVFCPLSSSIAASNVPASGFWNSTDVYTPTQPFTVGWNAPAGAASYKIYEMKTGTPVVIASPNSATYQLNGLSSGFHLLAVTALTGTGQESLHSVPIIVVVP